MRRKWILGALLALFLTPPFVVLLMRWLPPPTSAFMLQSAVKPVRYQWTDQTGEAMRRAVIAAEDQKFWDHHGFDVEAMQKAYARNQRSKRIRGGSTITQQTAKNLFLWSGGGYFRKGVEATFTGLIELCWSKERILTMYLNLAEFGPGLYGVEAAAQHYFRKRAAQLTFAEAARLAAVLPNPKRYRVNAPGPYVERRAAWILRQMNGVSADEPEEEAQ